MSVSLDTPRSEFHAAIAMDSFQTIPGVMVSMECGRLDGVQDFRSADSSMNQTNLNQQPAPIGAKQRAFTRVPFEHTLRWSYAPGEAGVACVCNISRGGLSVAMGRYLRPGRVVLVQFDDLDFNGEALAFDARIVWCCSSRDGHDGFHAGLQVLHGKPITLAKISEIFYLAISRLAADGMPCVEPTQPALKSPSLAS